MINNNDIKIFINPGHAGDIDPGAVRTWDGVTYREADIVDAIGILLKDALVKEGFQVEVLQSDNLCGERGSDGRIQYFEDSVCYKANMWQANVFISLHCNSFSGENAYGTETWYFPGSGSGRRLAYAINNSICNKLGTADRMDVVEGNPAKAKKLMVLKNTNMPAVLVELAFLSNKKDAKKLINNKEEFVAALVNGIEVFLG